MGSISEWLQRCSAARAAEQPIPEAMLFRRMLSHDEWYKIGGDVYCMHALLPKSTAVEQWSGLQLAHSIEEGTLELRLHFDASGTAMGPLSLSPDEIAHFRSFLRIAVVEGLLTRLHTGADLQVDEPFARLREYDGFLAVCAASSALTGDGADRMAPLMMALAPDDGGRKLAAAFTAQDALQLFVASRNATSSAEGVRAGLLGEGCPLSGCTLASSTQMTRLRP
jgi:hypothetical protein